MVMPEKVREIYRSARCIYSKEQIEEALDRMASDMNEQLAEANPVLITILKGGVVLTGNLLPRLDFPLEIDNAHATRYGTATTGGELHWKIKPSVDLKDRVVVVLDDILDLGITLKAVMDYCSAQGASKVYAGVLLDKKVVRPSHGLAEADFVALTVEDKFVFGYGLDYAEYLRNAPGIYEAAIEHQ